MPGTGVELPSFGVAQDTHKFLSGKDLRQFAQVNRAAGAR